MWRRVVSSSSAAQLQALAASRSLTRRFLISSASTPSTPISPPPPVPLSSSFFFSHFNCSSLFSRSVYKLRIRTSLKKKVEDIMPIAAGHEREELQAELEGRDILEIDYPVGPFGTKVAPALVKSYFVKRIIGCPGVQGEEEHDVVWFWLEKGKPHECPVCSQYFKSVY
ncbi:cytochrome c oxidase subunit 5b-2, mitochondrial-like [Argentina anserina]|uniref:cytochrome c oxidase subunit 5b-2, mitochondrial-like n=1 Tax=Argentina anserina TaxID=57926 RepID=UPI0021768DCF|nr:cytochrome c oxidase subunit 5b-2, mitochondrial-like [Potentilla anserina]